MTYGMEWWQHKWTLYLLIPLSMYTGYGLERLASDDEAGSLIASGFGWIVIGPAFIDLILTWRRTDAEAAEAARTPFVPREDWYGEDHQKERRKYAEVIREHGGICMEAECVRPTRRIKKGARWHLAHDHENGGRWDYLGPDHPECNEAEARSRGVVWEGTLEEYVEVSSAEKDRKKSSPTPVVNPWAQAETAAPGSSGSSRDKSPWSSPQSLDEDSSY